VNHEQQDRPDKSDGVPAIAFRVQVGFRGMEWIFKRQYGRLERQAVFDAIYRRFFWVSRPAHRRLVL
jgi:hypothetical protein